MISCIYAPCQGEEKRGIRAEGLQELLQAGRDGRAGRWVLVCQSSLFWGRRSGFSVDDLINKDNKGGG